MTVLASLPPSGTLAVGERVRTLRAAGRTIFNLSGGAPDPAPPVGLTPPAITPGENALGDPWGEPFLRRAFAERLARRHGVVRGECEMVATIGAKQGVYFAALALLEPGDEVLVLDPCWVTYAPSVALAGGKAVLVGLARPDNRLDVAALEAALTPRTRAILVNTPHNPTGRVFTEAELSALADLVKRRDLWLICDESFDLFVFDDGLHLSPGAFDAIRDRTILLYSFSKAFALPSYRIGMLVGPEPVCRLVATCTQQLISSVSLVSQKVACEAMAQEAEWAPFLRRTYQDKRDACLEILRRDSRFDAPTPQGSFYLFPGITRFGLSSDALTARLLDKAGVAVTSGAVFGAAGEGHIRVNLVGPLPVILDGAQALLRGLPG
ncbi:MAG: aminotransferase class I/II-fold pyridoxal phosphate-dependent enzyme [Rhodospirillales bacterium]|nr:aminotransferase class I/II-fold pyridoxal phosphate-dependent enzyme [Rhodospirillales bacterium]